MGRNLLTATFDAATELKDAGALTASGAGQVGGVARVVNVGNAFLQATLVVDVDTMDATSGDESYEVRLQGSTDPTFATNSVTVASVRVSAAATAPDTVAKGTGRYEKPFLNSADGATPLPYLRVYLVAAGTTPSINYRAWITKNPTV